MEHYLPITHKTSDFVTECVMQVVKGGYLHEDRHYLVESVPLDITKFATTLSKAFTGFKAITLSVTNGSKYVNIIKHFEEISKTFGGVMQFIRMCGRLCQSRVGNVVYSVINNGARIANKVVSVENGVEVYISDLCVAKQIEAIKDIIHAAISIITPMVPAFGVIAGAVIHGLAQVIMDVVLGESSVVKLAASFIESFYEALVPSAFRNIIGEFSEKICNAVEDEHINADARKRYGTDLVWSKEKGRYIKVAQAEREQKKAEQGWNDHLAMTENNIESYLECREKYSWKEFLKEYTKDPWNKKNYEDLIKIPDNQLKLRYTKDSGRLIRRGDYVHGHIINSIMYQYQKWCDMNPVLMNHVDKEVAKNESIIKVKIALYDMYKECKPILLDYKKRNLIPALILERVKASPNENYEMNERFFNKMMTTNFNAQSNNAKIKIATSLWGKGRVVIYKDEYKMAIIDPGIESTCKLILRRPTLKPITKLQAIEAIQEMRRQRGEQSAKRSERSFKQNMQRTTFANDATAVRRNTPMTPDGRRLR